VYYGELEKEYNLLKCTKKDVFIVPIISNKRGSCFEPNLLEDIEMIVAPIKCDDFDEKQYI